MAGSKSSLTGDDFYGMYDAQVSAPGSELAREATGSEWASEPEDTTCNQGGGCRWHMHACNCLRLSLCRHGLGSLIAAAHDSRTGVCD